ncbi:MAG: hhaIM 2 [Sporomusa sp.]|jgi:DNA (cytosine-5)-methyltransferase 1|nr:hhaIM 2 [Sporomusa sp.]
MNIPLLGSHFDGISGFPLAALRHGIIPVWASEVEPGPIAVSKKHFPELQHLGDITKVNGSEICPVDVVTFGSPCQDLSAAGKGAGMKVVCSDCGYAYEKKTVAEVKALHSFCPDCFSEAEVSSTRSGLFMEAIRINREMRDDTCGIFPRFLLWENVAGALSSNGGADFKTVLEEIAETKISMPRSGKWANAGMVRSNGVDIAWRILDAQYWGVPQRRKRIFLVADFGGRRAGEILFKPESLPRYIAESKGTRQGATPNAEKGIRIPIWDIGGRRRVLESINISPTLLSKMGTGGNNVPIVPAVGFKANASISDNAPVLNEATPPLQTTSQIAVAFPEVSNPLLAKGNLSYRMDMDTVVAIQHSVIGRSDNAGPAGPGYREDNKMFTLDSRGAAVATVDCRNLYENPELSGTLQSKSGGGHSLNYQNPVRIGYVVRRLTPLECERLQGFPDFWTMGQPDTTRYKMLGNSVAIPCPDYVLDGIAKALRGELPL